MIEGNIDKAIKVLGFLFALGSILWAIHQYTDSIQSSNRAKVLEIKKSFLERQLNLYTEATLTASKLATNETPEEFDRHYKRFWELYWGELALVESKDVEGAMVSLGKELKKSKPDKEKLQTLSLNLAHACRLSIHQSWKIDEILQ